ncbi:hypothetical protein [Nesterenkonia marinintestina]|uniref:hypothetical protein n=1 Tax=Nesterenkonia marinintestina TaxID=2979865 RepID=UPI0021C1635B|nr:hypothetical protein [Nesterenkonia sp. GX14115]
MSARPRAGAEAAVADRERPLSRGILLLGTVLTAAAFVSLVMILGAYFLSVEANPTFYFLALWGFPAGFALMLVHMVLSMRRRRTVRSG